MKPKSYLALFAILFLFMAGCSFERNLKIDARLSRTPAVKQIPLRIGVYYNPEFIEFAKKFELIVCGPNGRKNKTNIFFTFPVGTASRDLFDQCISSMFASVLRIFTPDQFSTQASPINGWLEPKIESFNWGENCTNDYFSSLRLTANIVYSVNLYNSDSHLVTSIKAIGSGIEMPKACFKDCWRDSHATEQAIQDAIAKFMIDFYEQPDVLKWLSSNMVVPGNLR